MTGSNRAEYKGLSKESFDRGSARRQFYVSLQLIGAMAFAVLVLYVLLPAFPPAGTSAKRFIGDPNSQFSGRLVVDE